MFPPEAPESDAQVRIFIHPESYRWPGVRRLGRFALAGARRLRTGADKAVLGLGPTTVGLEWHIVSEDDFVVAKAFRASKLKVLACPENRFVVWFPASYETFQ